MGQVRETGSLRLATLTPLFILAPCELMDSYTVSSYVNSPRN